MYFEIWAIKNKIAMYILISYFLLLLVISNSQTRIGFLILKTTTLFSFFVVLITEILSFFNSLNSFSIAFSWVAFSSILVFTLILKIKKLKQNIVLSKIKLISVVKSLLVYEIILIAIIVIIILLLFYQGILYPPNNWDSLTYHMSRIMYWIGNENVNHFPTHILRHLYQPPFSEYLLLHINLLDGNDYLSNSVQLLFLLFTLFAIYVVLSYFEVSRFHKILALLFAITIPSVILQSTTTKNDIVCAFFVITSLCFAIKSYYVVKWENYFYLGLAIGLGMLTKGTSYIFIAPIIIIFIIFLILKIIKSKNLYPIYFGILSVVLIIIINLGHFSRNYSIDQNILNIDKKEAKMYSNNSMDKKLLLSNFLKNIGLHMGYGVDEKYDEFIKYVHYEYEIFIDSPEVNFFGMPYKGADPSVTHEDLAPNTAHILLIFLSSIIIIVFSIIKWKKNKKAFLLLFLIFLQILLFVGYLKWQPWHTRLHIPIFLISICLIFISVKIFKPMKWIVILYIPILLINFYYYFAFNSLRPILQKEGITKEINRNDNRYKKYFSNQIQLYPEYSIIKSLLQQNSFKKLGMIVTDWEYPLLIDSYQNKMQIKAINVNNITAKIPQDTKNIDAIISNTLNQEYIIFEGKKYKNLTQKNSFIWIYKL